MTAPVPDPPEVVSVRGVAKVPEVEETTRVVSGVSARAGDTESSTAVRATAPATNEVRHAADRLFNLAPSSQSDLSRFRSVNRIDSKPVAYTIYVSGIGRSLSADDPAPIDLDPTKRI